MNTLFKIQVFTHCPIYCSIVFHRCWQVIAAEGKINPVILVIEGLVMCLGRVDCVAQVDTVGFANPSESYLDVVTVLARLVK